MAKGGMLSSGQYNNSIFYNSSMDKFFIIIFIFCATEQGVFSQSSCKSA